MNRRLFGLGWLVALSLPFMGFRQQQPADQATEKLVSAFSLPSVSGKLVSLGEFSQAKGFVVVFTANICPFAKLYTSRLNDLNAKYKPLGVPLLTINSMDTVVYADETFEAMKTRAQVAGFKFPYLKDAQQEVAKDFGARRTPHAFLIWKEKGNWVVKYSGAIDDNGLEPGKVTRPYLTQAVDALLKGKPVAEQETYSIGCTIHFRK